MVTAPAARSETAGDGQVGLVEVVAGSEEPLEDAPLLVLGVSVLDETYLAVACLVSDRAAER